MMTVLVGQSFFPLPLQITSIRLHKTRKGGRGGGGKGGREGSRMKQLKKEKKNSPGHLVMPYRAVLEVFQRKNTPQMHGEHIIHY